MPNGSSFFESRDKQREATELSIWPPSPRSPYQSDDERLRREKRKKSSSSRHKHSSSKRHKRHRPRHRDDTETDESDDEYETRRRRHREKSRERRHRDRYESPRRSEIDSGAEEEEKRRRRRREKEKERQRDSVDDDSSDERRRRRHHSSKRKGRHSDEEDVKDSAGKRHERDSKERIASEGALSGADRSLSDKEIEVDRAGAVRSAAPVRIGPQLPVNPDDKEEEHTGADPRAYGKALLPGEGSAMANFVQEGKRIPRRGEIGLSSEQIENYERAGFVMSGSRHARMNAVRIRKENQIYSAEEQRSILKMIAEEKKKKEAAVIEQFKDMVDSMGN